MKAEYIILFFAAGLMLVTSCRKSSFVAQKNDTTAMDVYIAGSIGNKALYWKNTNAISLDDNGVAPVASSIFVADNNDVYVAGSDIAEAAGSPHRALYWKNGQATYLTDPQQVKYAGALSVFVAGNDVYIGGYENIAGEGYTTYWRNGTTNIVGQLSGSTNAIFVSGSDIYLGGGSESQPGLEHATYWKNGMQVSLSTDSYKGFISSLVVSDGHVYAAGYVNYSDGIHAVYWKDAIAVKLTNAPVTSVASSIFVSGNDIYVAGYEIINSISTAVYWKNGTPVTLSEQTSAAESIWVSGNDVYVAGQDKPDTAVVATYWKNGLAKHLSVSSGMATSIFLKSK